ncbi:divalent-cation tolerance protein CutA [candidate division WOR-3 bacterium]|uniref:Divalent-cation tolerance protein CutA n=1 Tax=candidate division WOR-3 bacterium TaxID=2052148 RepID=A0A937XK42_UNCW3|nr:divalent-cation tolerance protein CutA [candidate division WOR-3 bacterium]
MEKYLQLATTTPRRSVARRIARALVDSRLAACVQIVGPIESVYRWQGKIETASEWLCLIKTTRARLRAIAAMVQKHHPYDTPELVALPISAGSRRYLEWLAAAVRSPATQPTSARRSSCR